MVLTAFNLFIGAAGLSVMILATCRFHKLISHTREVSYSAPRTSFNAQFLSLALMYLFSGGFIFSIVHTLQHQVDDLFTLAMSVIFLGAVFIHTSTTSQINMSVLLRTKNMEIMKTFVNAIDLKDSYTKGHSEHVYDLAELIYGYLPAHYCGKLNKSRLLDAAMLHDCGKISIKDEVLNKRGRLGQEDWEAIKSHTVTGKRMLDDTCFSDISDWVLYHHERIDGKGYYGLAGDEIPLESRIIAIADTYSALSTDRTYRKHYSHEQAVEIMALSTGSQLDAELMGCFMRIPVKKLHKILPRDGVIYCPVQTHSAAPGSGHDAGRTGRSYYLH